MNTLIDNLKDVALLAAAPSCAWNDHVHASVRAEVERAVREARIHGYTYPDFSKASRLVGHLRVWTVAR